MNEMGHSKPVHWDNPEGWDEEGGGMGFWNGRHMYPWLIQVNVWQKLSQYYKVIILQLKLISFFLKKNKRIKRNEWRE